jgi:hypothetical protein
MWLWVLAALCGVLFFWRAPTLWPLVRTDVRLPDGVVLARARAVLRSVGLSADGSNGRVTFSLYEHQVDFLDQTFGREEAQRRIALGAPVVWYSVALSRPGDFHVHRFDLHPNGKLLHYSTHIEDDDPPIPDTPIAEPLARARLGQLLGDDLSSWRNISVARREQPVYVERTFVYERLLEKGLRERATIEFAGPRVIRVWRNLVTPPGWRRAQGPVDNARETLGAIGLLLFAPMVLVGAGVFLFQLRAGTARLRGPARLSGGAFLLLVLSEVLRFSEDYPRIPDYLELFRKLVGVFATYGWTFALLFAVISTGDALNSTTGRGKTLEAFSRGNWRAPGVAAASRNGFLIGLVCGGLMAAVIWLLERAVGAHVALQPRHFHLEMLNSINLPIATVTYFLQIALLEELGYRYFAATWLERKLGRRWLAVLLPALVYGLTHTSLEFLPPAEPFWARALVMSLIGVVWGWAFFRFDALTVVLSHLAADLFIFNWPGIVQGDIGSILAVAAPLLPALLGGRYASARRAGSSASDAGASPEAGAL